MKKITYLFTLLITSVLVIGVVKAGFLDDIAQARQNGTDLKTHSAVKLNKKIPKDYSFALGNMPSSDVTYRGQVAVTSAVKTAWQTAWDGTSRWNLYSHYFFDGTPTIARQSDKSSINNKYSALYKAVDTYNNKLIDVKMTLVDYELIGGDFESLVPVINFESSRMGVATLGIEYVTVKFEFFESGTTTPVTIKGNTSIWDIDANQGVVLPGDMPVYAVSNNVLKLYAGSKNYIFDGHGNNDSMQPIYNSNNEVQNTECGITTIFNKNNFTLSFVSKKLGLPAETADLYSAKNRYDLFWISSIPAVPAPPVAPVKEVDKDKVKVGEEFTYTLTQKVPQMIDQYYYKKFALIDKFEDCLQVDTSKIRILENGQDVTSKFNITANGQTITMEVKQPNDQNFYGKTYVIEMKTKIKENYNIEKWKVGDEYVVPNKVTLNYTDYDNEQQSIDSEEVKVRCLFENIVKVPNTLAGLPLYVVLTGLIMLILGGGTLIYMKFRKRA